MISDTRAKYQKYLIFLYKQMEEEIIYNKLYLIVPTL